MKDYSIGKNKEFILGYEMKDGQIIVKYAGGGTLSFAHTRENEIKILNKMKEQVMKYHYDGDKIKENIVFSLKIALSSVAGIIISVGICSIGATILGGIVTSLASLGFAFGVVGAVAFKEQLDDLRKNNLFVDNEQKLTQMIKENAEELDKTMVESKVAEKYNKLDKPELTLNTIDKLSLTDLKRILESIERSESLGVQSTDAFEETLEAFNKAKKKEKVKKKN